MNRLFALILALLLVSSFIPGCFFGEVLAHDSLYGQYSTFAHFHIDVLAFSVISFWRILCTFSRIPLMI